MTPQQAIQHLRQIQKLTKKAARQTVSKARGQVRTNLIRQSAKSLSMKQKAIRSRTYMTPIRQSRNITTAALFFKPNQQNLRRFVVGQPRKAKNGTAGGLYARVLGNRQFFEGAFFATMPNGERLVFTSPRRGVLKAVRGTSSRGVLLEGNKQDTSMIPIHFKRFTINRLVNLWSQASTRFLRNV